MAAANAFAITPSDTVVLPSATTGGIYVGSTGTITLTTYQNVQVTFSGLVAGIILPVIAKQVWSTGTTASNLVGMVN